MDEKSQIKEIVRLYGKIFLSLFIPGSLILGLFWGMVQLLSWFITRSIDSVSHGSIELSSKISSIASYLQSVGWVFICQMVVLGLVFLFMGTAHIVAVRRLPYGKRPGALDVHQIRSIELQLPYDKVFDLCLEAILVQGGMIYLKKPEQGKIMAKTGLRVSMISLNMVKLDDKTTRVRISSKPSVQVFTDMGGNLANVNSIADFLKLKEEQALAA